MLPGMARPKRFSCLPLFDFAADFAAVTAAYATTYLARFESVWGERLFIAINRFLGVRETGFLGESLAAFYQGSALRLVLLLMATLFPLYALRDLYAGARFLRRRPVAWNVLVANLQALAIFYAYFYLRRNVFHPRGFFVTVLVLNVFYTVAFRAAMARLLQWLRRRGFDRRPAVLAGAGAEADTIVEWIRLTQPHGIELAARVGALAGKDFETRLQELEATARAHNAALIIAADRGLEVAQIMRLLEMADRLEADAKVLSDKLDVLADEARLPVDRFHGLPLLHFNAPALSRRSLWLRRALYRAASAAALAAALPLLALLAALVRLTSPGPALFIQERIGVNRRPFRMYKFRTMYDGAEEALAQVEEFNESGRALFKMRRDPRVTPVGRFLRRFSLDEFPQLLNVVRGEMTLVGPRPLPRRDFEHYYEDWHYSRHSGMPGLTCLWQVSGRSDIDFHNMCILDVYYLRNQSWVLDLKILLRTVWVVLFAKGAY